MKLFDKIKNALFEEVEDEEDTNEEQTKIVKKIDVEKTTEEIPLKKEVVVNNFEEDEEIRLPKFSDIENEIKPKFETSKKEPIIFDDDDFFSDTREISFKETEKDDKIIYGGYETKEKLKEKEKFSPSPIISPVYGVLNKNYKKESFEPAKKTLDHLFVEERKKSISLDSVRKKAFGANEESEEDILLYEMSEDDRPGIERVTLGDAEEYFDDLGLEYDIDYKDISKDKNTRSKKNEELSEKIEKALEEEMDITSDLISNNEEKDNELEITDDFDFEEETELNDKDLSPDNEEENQEEVEEKNLYDLINMMYEGKE